MSSAEETLSSGEIVAIVIGAAIFVVLISICCWGLCNRENKWKGYYHYGPPPEAYDFRDQELERKKKVKKLLATV